MMKKYLFPAILVILLVLTGCQPQPTPSDSTPTAVSSPQAEATSEPSEGMAISSAIVLDPAVTEDEDSLLVSGYLYEGLVLMDDRGNIQPAIASSWIISDDQLDYIFEIRPNAAFSDGTPITTDIIVDNFNRWFDPQSPFHGSGNY